MNGLIRVIIRDGNFCFILGFSGIFGLLEMLNLGILYWVLDMKDNDSVNSCFFFTGEGGDYSFLWVIDEIR